jgi:predicted nucleic acid-binding protein
MEMTSKNSGDQFVFSGLPYQILKARQPGAFEMVVSPEILGEHRRVGDVLAEEHPNIALPKF